MGCKEWRLREGVRGLCAGYCVAHVATTRPPACLSLRPLPQAIGSDCQLVVICGRNARLVERLQKK